MLLKNALALRAILSKEEKGSAVRFTRALLARVDAFTASRFNKIIP